MSGDWRRTNSRLRAGDKRRGHVTEGDGRGRNDRPTAADRLEVALKSGPVKTWAAMTPEERANVLKTLKGR